MKIAYKIASGVFVLLMFLVSIGIYMVWQDYLRFLATPMTIEKLPFLYTVDKGSSLRSVVDELVNKDHIEHGKYLLWYGRSEDIGRQIKAGEYSFNKPPTPLEFLDRLVSGQVSQYSLTIVEGWSFRQMLSAIRSNQYITQTITDLDSEAIMKQLGQEGQHPEGLFFPDTYLFPKNTIDLDFLERSMRMMQQVLDEEWAAREENLPIKSPYEALILASIIEKETGVPNERPEIAGVFVRRLQKGMLLQTDPTVIYGMGDQYDGNIRRRDLKTDTPYNTYTRRGLPPTPIALPGREAIHAALHPAPGKALYFVARGDGSHQFSDTLKAHNLAVAKYQLKKK
ncbi:MAG: endolytic transglycosylase MltG [Gammaproteobacteria bacterium]|nr:MAG: endolytic transglycosylase MltG [Gammaproteobacteria bacterium]